ncbi:unnamed protein product [Dovyalis caffra]|uniref:DUF4283 domain-containing protein n=1 Tax=Dovyalis caffra TaxID=77055 RepID=A0AAV1SRP2_9ROSI|nr:unnamed protein product [Dovyalis caffra]
MVSSPISDSGHLDFIAPEMDNGESTVAISKGPSLMVLQAGRLGWSISWQRCRDIQKIVFGKIIPIWVKLWGTPMQLLSREGLSRIASASGVPLFMDTATQYSKIISFAKVCVQVDITTKLLDDIKVDMDGKSQILSLRHTPDNCPCIRSQDCLEGMILAPTEDHKQEWVAKKISEVIFEKPNVNKGKEIDKNPQPNREEIERGMVEECRE